MLMLVAGACSPTGLAPSPAGSGPGSPADTLPVRSGDPSAAPTAAERSAEPAGPTLPVSQPPTPTPPATAAPPPTPAPTPGGAITLPILYQHQVAPFPATWPAMTAAQRKTFLETDTLPWALEAQLDWLAARGYTTILPGDLAAWFDAGTPLPPRPVMLTFDDGFPDWVTTVLPLLRARGMTAEFYVTIDAVKDGRLPWDRVRELAAAGMGIGGHDVHHIQLASVGSATAPVSAATFLGGGGAASTDCVAAGCTAAALAAFDLSQWQSMVATTLPQSAWEVVQTVSGNPSSYTLTISWVDRLSDTTQASYQAGASLGVNAGGTGERFFYTATRSVGRR